MNKATPPDLLKRYGMHWHAFWHQLFGLWSGHWVMVHAVKPAGSFLFRTKRITCSCGKEWS